MDTPPALPTTPSSPQPPRPPGNRSQRRAVLVAAIVVGAGLFAFPVVKGFRQGYEKAQQRRESLREVEEAIAASKSKMRDAFNEETGFSAEKGAEAADLLTKQLDKASKDLSGDDARAALATRNWLMTFQEKGAAYNALLQEIEINKLLDLSTVDQTALEQRRKNVERMLAANTDLSNSVRNAEKDFSAELVKAGVGPKMQEEVMEGFRRGARHKHELILKVRATDQLLGEAAIELFNLMSREWGKWEFDKKDSLVRFDSDNSLTTYQGIMQRIQKASQEQLDAQRELTQSQ